MIINDELGVFIWLSRRTRSPATTRRHFRLQRQLGDQLVGRISRGRHQIYVPQTGRLHLGVGLLRRPADRTHRPHGENHIHFPILFYKYFFPSHFYRTICCEKVVTFIIRLIAEYVMCIIQVPNISDSRYKKKKKMLTRNGIMQVITQQINPGIKYEYMLPVGVSNNLLPHSNNDPSSSDYPNPARSRGLGAEGGLLQTIQQGEFLAGIQNSPPSAAVLSGGGGSVPSSLSSSGSLANLGIDFKSAIQPPSPITEASLSASFTTEKPRKRNTFLSFQLQIIQHCYCNWNHFIIFI